MAFKFGTGSLSCLKDVKPELVAVMKKALGYSEDIGVDFAVTCGKRTPPEHEKFVAKGACWHWQSKHLTGDAVDLAAYIYMGRGSSGPVDPRLTLELAVYDNIAEAVRRAAIEQEVAVRWGACWHIEDIGKWKGTMKEARLDYINAQRMKGQCPFIDAGHFELS